MPARIGRRRGARQADKVVAKLHTQKPGKAAELVKEAVKEMLAYCGFPEEHRPLERIIREIRRRTRAVGALPDGDSALNLAAARLGASP